MNEDEPKPIPDSFESSLTPDDLKRFTKDQRRSYYDDMFPDALGVGRTIPFTFIVFNYLPALVQRYGDEFKVEVESLVEDEGQLKQEAERFKEQFDRYVEQMSSKDPLLAAIVNSTKGIHFINMIAILDQTPSEWLGIPQDYSLDSSFWQNLQKIVEGAQIE